MRVTNKMQYFPLQNNISNIETQRNRSQEQISSGKDMLSIADDPARMGETKKLSSKITQNKNYISILGDANSEMLTVEAKLGNISDTVQKIRQIAIDATQTGNMGNLYSLGVSVKGYLKDMLESANGDYNGKYLFSGTKTGPDSITPQAPQKDDKPFELIESTPTASNPSGLSVVFKGNMKDRVINKEANSTETINVKADEAFGDEGTELFNTVIGLYNLMSYTSDGKIRSKEDLFSKEDTEKLDGLQKTIGDLAEEIDQATGRNGSVMTRLDALSQLLQNENTMLGESLSSKQDTDVAKTSIELKLADTAYQYTLQAGANIIQKTLFDFLT